jgi:hypothetical protein
MSDYLEEKEKFMRDRTLTVEKLINILNKYPKQMPVMCTWESTVNELREEYIYEAMTGTLYIDGDYGFYKKDFEK